MTTAERFNAAVKLRLENKLDACQEACDKLWREGFQVPQLALLRGNLQLDLGNYHDSLGWYETAWSMVAPGDRVKPEWNQQFPEVALPLAYARMRAGDWSGRTWALWEVGRLTRSWHPAPNTRPWDGSPEKMLVLSEGGFGDVFLFSRFFQKLDPIQRAASRLVMGPHFDSMRSLKQTWDGMETVWPDEHLNWKSFRFSTALMSLMAVQGIRKPEDIPAADTSLSEVFPRPDRGRDWGTARFGLCWSAEENGVQKRIRSIDNPADLEPLCRWQFLSLNPGKALLSAPTMPRLLNVPLKSWADTVCEIAALDCVVSVDTACLHLAGLLGVPAIGIIPLNSDWKWGLDREDSFWWPSVKLVRNTSPYTLKPALERAAEMLERM
jgi:hypothetical protein